MSLIAFYFRKGSKKLLHPEDIKVFSDSDEGEGV